MNENERKEINGMKSARKWDRYVKKRKDKHMIYKRKATSGACDTACQKANALQKKIAAIKGKPKMGLRKKWCRTYTLRTFCYWPGREADREYNGTEQREPSNMCPSIVHLHASARLQRRYFWNSEILFFCVFFPSFEFCLFTGPGIFYRRCGSETSQGGSVYDFISRA